MAIPRRQKAACIRALSAALAICLLPMGAAQAELFGPHYRSWGWNDYRPHYRSWAWDDYEPYRQRRHRAHKGYDDLERPLRNLLGLSLLLQFAPTLKALRQ